MTFFKKNKNDFFNIKNKQHKNKNQNTSAIHIVQKFMKKFSIIVGILFLPIILFFVLIIATIIAVWHWLNPIEFNGVMTNFLATQGQHYNLLGGFINSVVQAVCAVFYLILIKPILWLLKIIQDIIYFLGGGSFTNALFFNNKDWHGVPNLFIALLGLSFAVLAVILAVKLIEIKISNWNKASQIGTAAKNLLLLTPLMLAIPIAFYVFNTVINLFTQELINNGTVNSNDLGLFIFNSSFDNGFHNFDYVPDSWGFADNGNFNYLICLVTEAFMMYILLLVSIQLFVICAELLIFLIIGCLLATTIVQDEGRKFRNWKDLVVARFLSFSFIFLVYNIFLSSIPVISKTSTLMPNDLARPIFSVIGIISFGIVVTKSSTLLSSVLGTKASLFDSINGLRETQTATAGIMGATTLASNFIKMPLKTASHTVGTAGAINTLGKEVGYGLVAKEIIKRPITHHSINAFDTAHKNVNNWIGTKDYSSKKGRG